MTAGENGNGHVELTAKDFKTDQEVRWCPGCGDYAILAAMQGFMPELGIERERLVFVIDQRGKNVKILFRADDYLVMVGLVGARDGAGEFKFVRFPFGERDREGLDRLARHPAHHRRDRARINSA